MLLLVGVPLGDLLYKAGLQVTATDAGRTRNWSAAKVLEGLAAAPHQFRGELWLSTRLGAAAATASLVFALPLAWSMRPSLTKRPSVGLVLRSPWLQLLAVSLCLTIPGPLLGVVVIRILNRPPDSPLSFLAVLYDSNFAPWLVRTVRTMPLATLILWPALASVPQVMLDTAATDGTGWWGRLLRIRFRNAGRRRRPPGSSVLPLPWESWRRRSLSYRRNGAVQLSRFRSFSCSITAWTTA